MKAAGPPVAFIRQRGEREVVQRGAEIDGIVRGGQKIRDARIHRGFAASDG